MKGVGRIIEFVKGGGWWRVRSSMGRLALGPRGCGMGDHGEIFGDFEGVGGLRGCFGGVVGVRWVWGRGAY